MNKINRIKIGGFRRLFDVDLPIRPLMVLIGANGAGKTSLLDALSLLSASAAGRLNSGLSELGGITSVLTRARADAVSLLVDMEVPGYEPLEYDLSLSPKSTGYAITHEVLSQAREGYPEPFKHVDSRDGDIKYFEIEEGRLLRPEWSMIPGKHLFLRSPRCSASRKSCGASWAPPRSTTCSTWVLAPPSSCRSR
jgi:predicted ATPase